MTNFGRSTYADFGSIILDEVLEWLSGNIGVRDVYTMEDICEAAKDSIARYYDPDDLIPYDELVDWALDNGFVRQEE